MCLRRQVRPQLATIAYWRIDNVQVSLAEDISSANRTMKPLLQTPCFKEIKLHFRRSGEHTFEVPKNTISVFCPSQKKLKGRVSWPWL